MFSNCRNDDGTWIDYELHPSVADESTYAMHTWMQSPLPRVGEMVWMGDKPVGIVSEVEIVSGTFTYVYSDSGSAYRVHKSSTA